MADIVLLCALAALSGMVGLFMYDSRPPRTSFEIGTGSQASQEWKFATDTTDRLPSEVDYVFLTEALKEGAVTVIDVRPEAFYKLGHIPGAVNVPKNRLEDDAAGSIPTFLSSASPIVLYCGGRSCSDADAARRALRRAGFKNLSVYVGGWGEWKEISDGADER